MEEYREIAEKIGKADAVLIGASNGFSISEGLHILADNEAFEEIFDDFKKACGIRSILMGIFARWHSEETKWAFFSRLINHYSIGYTGSPNTLPGAFYIAVNAQYAFLPEQIEEKGFVICEDIGRVLEDVRIEMKGEGRE